MHEAGCQGKPWFMYQHILSNIGILGYEGMLFFCQNTREKRRREQEKKEERVLLLHAAGMKVTILRTKIWATYAGIYHSSVPDLIGETNEIFRYDGGEYTAEQWLWG